MASYFFVDDVIVRDVSDACLHYFVAFNAIRRKATLAYWAKNVYEGFLISKLLAKASLCAFKVEDSPAVGASSMTIGHGRRLR